MRDDIERRVTRLEEAVATMQEAFALLDTRNAAIDAPPETPVTPDYPTPCTYEQIYGPVESWVDAPLKPPLPSVLSRRSWWRVFFREDAP